VNDEARILAATYASRFRCGRERIYFIGTFARFSDRVGRTARILVRSYLERINDRDLLSSLRSHTRPSTRLFLGPIPLKFAPVRRSLRALRMMTKYPIPQPRVFYCVFGRAVLALFHSSSTPVSIMPRAPFALMLDKSFALSFEPHRVVDLPFTLAFTSASHRYRSVGLRPCRLLRACRPCAFARNSPVLPVISSS